MGSKPERNLNPGLVVDYQATQMILMRNSANAMFRRSFKLFVLSLKKSISGKGERKFKNVLLVTNV